MNTPISELYGHDTDLLPPPMPEDPTEKDLTPEVYEVQLRIIFDDLCMAHKSIMEVLASPRLKDAKSKLIEVAGVDRTEFVLDELIHQNRGMIKPLIHLL